MEKTILMALAMLIAIILFIILVGFVFCVIVSAIRYVYGEAIHTIRNMKRSVREACWDLEWKFKRR